MSRTIANEIKYELEQEIEGEVRVDDASRVLYSTDSSIYQTEPIGVVLPKSKDDVTAIVSWAVKHQVPLLPRGGGSSLAGQAVGPALVIDFSRYVNQVEMIDVEEKSAWVQPGMVLSQFNNSLRKYQLQFGPDPASGERATMGGIFGNNATGAHSILYGMAIDHILELDMVLSDGRPYTLSMFDVDGVAALAQRDGVLAEIAKLAIEIRMQSDDLIQQKWPKTWRNASGYAINYLVPWSPSSPPGWYSNEFPYTNKDKINLAQLMVGSEGTLGIFSRMKVRLVDIPQNKILAVIAFDSVVDAVKRTPEILSFEPSAVELVPRAIIEKARSVPAYAGRLSFLEGNPEALLFVEFSGEDSRLLIEQAAQLGNDVLVIEDVTRQKQLWEVRKVGLGLLMYMVGDAKPTPFLEDVAVPVEHLAEFVQEFKRVLDEHNTTSDFYAHASAGCLHIRPVLNLKSADGRKRMVDITRQMVEIVHRFGGALSGEHGDGVARGMWLEKIYGEEITNLFRKVKNTCDPKGIFNPGKIVDAQPMDEGLRYGEAYKPQPWQPVMDFSSLDGVAGAIEMCNGAGVCRKDIGAMCPTFQASREEEHSTRGRSNLLREYISGKLLPKEQAQQAAFEALEMCLACKGCKAECPSSVDVAALKYEFMNHYYEEHRRPLGDYLFAYIGEFSKLGRISPKLVNVVTHSRIGKNVFEKVLLISKERTLPKMASKCYKQQALSEKPKEKVILLSDPFSEYFTTDLVEDFLLILSAVGVQVEHLGVVGAGRTKLSKGFIKPAARHAEKLVADIQRVDPANELPIVGIEPSEIVMLTDDILKLLSGNELVRDLSKRAFSLSEFLIRSGLNGEPRYKVLGEFKDAPSVLLHGHCYQKSMKPADDGLPNGVEADIFLLRALGCQVELIESGCCGMAGAFGYEVPHIEMSKQVAETHLLPAVRNKQPDQLVIASGASCRAQIDSLAGEAVLHPIQLIANLLKKF